MAFVIAESVLQLQKEKPPVLCNWMPVPQEALLQGSNDPKAGGRRQQAEASSLRQCLATIPSRTLGSMGGWDYQLAGEKPKSRVGRKWRAVGGLPLFEIQGWRLLALFVRTRLVLPSNRYRQA